jgi:predicted DNA-binding transcriptional regulator AlpA
MKQDQPSLEEVRAWPASVNVRDAARALGVSPSHAYAAIKAKDFPAKVINVGARLKVSTASIIEVLEAQG